MSGEAGEGGVEMPMVKKKRIVRHSVQSSRTVGTQEIHFIELLPHIGRVSVIVGLSRAVVLRERRVWSEVSGPS